ncbi:MAG: HAD family phosphatase [Oscillospiraceae bacterium]|nr:HAD family phosphatase [Oscillospiraceae bacterium]
MTYRLIAFDLDGTFLDDEKHIPPENLEALWEAHRRGLLLVPATGRTWQGIPEEIRALPFIRYAVVVNGASVLDREREQPLYRGEIPLALALETFAYLDRLPVVYDCYQNDEGWMSRRMLEALPPYFAREPFMLERMYRLRHPVEDLPETLEKRGEPVQKIQAYFLPENMDQRDRQVEILRRRFPTLVPTTSLKNNIELNSVTAGKDKGLLALCRVLGIEAAETAAIGDGSNDTEMLIAAGLGVAMRNGTEEVRAAADRVTERSNNEGGFAWELRRILREQED